MKIKTTLIKVLALSALCCSLSAQSATISWANWQSSTANSATGEAVQNGNTITINQTNTANNHFVNVNNTGTNFWGASGNTPGGVVNAYTQGDVSNAPVTSDIIALSAGGTVTINFTMPVIDVYFAMVSWNTNSSGVASSIGEFNAPIEVDSFGAGYWGQGSAVVNPDGTSFTATDEFHGVIKVAGTHSSITLTSSSELWHGFTVGFASEPTQASAPAGLALVLLTMGGLFARKRLARA